MNKGFNLIDSFLFSEPYEKDLLWVKFNLENKGVDQWIIIENSYTFQGEYKGLHAKDIIFNDERFKNFRDKVHIIEGEIIPRENVSGRKGKFDSIAFEVEHAQRELAKDYLLQNFKKKDFLFISDADECLDLSNEKRRKLLYKKIKKNDFTKVPRNRYWFDFDNLWMKNRSTPIVRLDLIYYNSIAKLRSTGISDTLNWRKKILFEYSFCFSKEKIYRKFCSQSHTGFSEEDINLALRCNHVPVSSIRGEKITLHPKFWLKKISPKKEKQPEFVQRNLNFLRTNVISKNYLYERRITYPGFYPSKFPFNFLQSLKRKYCFMKYCIVLFMKEKYGWILRKLKIIGL
jgi:hypothetical protein